MKKQILIVLVALVALVTIVFLLIWPAKDSLEITGAALDKEESRFSEVKEIEAKMKELDAKYKGNLSELEKVMFVLPQEEELASLLVQLENLASANGLIMNSVDFERVTQKIATLPSVIRITSEDILPKKTTNSSVTPASQDAQGSQALVDTYKILSVKLKLSGSYESFKSYLAAVEKNLRLMDITSLSFSAQNQSSPDLSGFSFAATVNVYYQ